MYATLAVAGLQLAGGYFAAENAREAAELNAEIAEMNAEFAELDAYDAEIDGYTQAGKYQSIVDQTLGKQRAELAAADVDLSFGSASTIMKETGVMSELNKLEIIKQGQERALGFEREARDIRLGGFLGRQQGEQRASEAQLAGLTGAARTTLSGYSSHVRDRTANPGSSSSTSSSGYTNSDGDYGSNR